MKPALTTEEWAIVKLRRAGKMIGGKVRGYVDEEWSDEIRHAVAAQCLYGYFAREDVKTLRLMAGVWHSGGSTPYPARALSLADRIEALLPPE